MNEQQLLLIESKLFKSRIVWWSRDDYGGRPWVVELERRDGKNFGVRRFADVDDAIQYVIKDRGLE